MTHETLTPMPAGACDCHMHVFGPLDRYPPAAVRGYTPRPRDFAEYRALAGRIGLERVVLVQPSAYGTDNRCMADTMRAAGDPTVRGVAVIDASTGEHDLDAWHELGVRGVRLNMVSSVTPDPAAARAALDAAARRVARLGWHVQVFAQPDLLVALMPQIAQSEVPVVIDHMGAADASLGVGQPVVEQLVRMLEAGRHWVKLAGANRISRQAGGFRDALPIMAALCAANPHRLVWGTDWPHIGPHAPGHHDEVVYMPHDNGELLGLLAEACGHDPALLARILSSNPAELYAFP